MPVKKIEEAANEAAAAKAGQKTPLIKEEGNFLVLSGANEDIGTGTKLVVVHVAKTQENAVSYIKKLTSSRPEFLYVVEKKSLFSRRPQIVVNEIKLQNA